MQTIEPDTIRERVRTRYGQIAENNGSCCGSVGASCRGGEEDYDQQLGYSTAEVASVPDGSNLGLGCGNPAVMASIRAGETILDLGSGAGFDCFLAAQQLSGRGRVIGVDMTSEMIAKARANARKGNYPNVEFRLGEIEALPVADNSIDLVISNCVVNLSPEKLRVFREVFRVLRRGGRLAISDVVTPIPLLDDIKRDLTLHTGCLAGASLISDLHAILEECGFAKIRITPKSESREFIRGWAPGLKLEDFVVSAIIQAIKPRRPLS